MSVLRRTRESVRRPRSTALPAVTALALGLAALAPEASAATTTAISKTALVTDPAA